MPPAPHELFKRRPFMQRTVRDDLIGLVAGLAGFTAACVLFGDVTALGFAIVGGVGLLMVAVHGVLRNAIRRRREAQARLTPPK